MSQGSCCGWLTGVKFAVYGLTVLGIAGATAAYVAPDATFGFLNKVTGNAFADPAEDSKGTCPTALANKKFDGGCGSHVAAEGPACCSASAKAGPPSACCASGKACCSKAPSVVELIVAAPEPETRKPVVAPRPAL